MHVRILVLIVVVGGLGSVVLGLHVLCRLRVVLVLMMMGMMPVWMDIIH